MLPVELPGYQCRHPMRHGRRRYRCSWMKSPAVAIVVLLVTVFTQHAAAAFISFDNCLSENIQDSDPLELQFVPLHVWADFNTSSKAHKLNMTIYGNVSGSATVEAYPSPDDPQWSNPNSTVGKIVDLSTSNNKYTTLFTTFNVLSYTPYDAAPARFCNSTINQECPLAPAFYVDKNNISALPAFTISHDLYSSYAFTTITATMRVTSGDASNADLACIQASITPDLGDSLRSVLTIIPLVVLVFVGVATAFAATFSPWGSTDIFRWTSNYGRDEDLLRLVTPGFTDCLQYIQFIFLTGSLSLDYPGYFQPVISQVAWSTLMFESNFISKGDPVQPVIDGVYALDEGFGLMRVSQLKGITSVEDIWAGTMVWLLAVIGAVLALIQMGFALRWCWRQLFSIPEEDLRAKNFPFSAGCVIRIVFNLFFLPIVAFSMFQFVVSSKSPAYVVALAAVVIVALVAFIGWILRLIAGTRPRSYLYDDLPTVLLYGPLYNTFSDNAATYALVPIIITFVRGITIGAVQPSGIAQLVLLAICEVMIILTLNAFRPFPSPTSMNLYHSCFALVRFFTIMLSVVFVPSLSVGDSPRGWIGYVILLMHAMVLVFGFFLNAAQTLVEVIARLAGAGGEAGVEGGAARGGLAKVFGMRQLSRRVPRRDVRTRHSTTSDAAILGNDVEAKAFHSQRSRNRSLSGSSALLLASRPTASDRRASTGLEGSSSRGFHSRQSGSIGAFTPTTPSPRGGIVGIPPGGAADPYYRPPRQRRATLDPMSPAERSRGSWVSGDWSSGRRFSQLPDDDDAGEGPSISGRGTPVTAQVEAHFDASDTNLPSSKKTDYAVRESDFYYGVRGPALSNLGTRKLKTGPADPTGPVSSATGWFKSLFVGKTKDKAKGFEVVRSSRAPPPGLIPPRSPHESNAGQDGVLYRDDPRDEPRRSSEGVNEAGDITTATVAARQDDDVSDLESGDLYSSSDDGSDLAEQRVSQISQDPPSLPIIDTGGAIELPSRVGSRVGTRKASMRVRPPTLPRKSSRRQSSNVSETAVREALQLPAIPSSRSASPNAKSRLYDPDDISQRHLRPGTADSRRLPFSGETSPGRTSGHSGASTRSSIGPGSIHDEVPRPSSEFRHARSRSSILGKHSADLRNDRPSSMGYVQQHRASDHIHKTSPEEEVSYRGSTAEFVEHL